jgi:SAM-dependent methyltransferase
VRVARGRPSYAGEVAMQRRAELARSFLLLSPGDVLDIGCGNGVATNEIVHGLWPPSRVWGVDVSSVAEATGGTFAMYDGRELPFPDASMGAVICQETIEHCDDDAALLREIARVMKPGAVLWLTAPNRWWIFETHGCWWPGPWHRVPFLSWLPKRLHDRVARARIYRKRDAVRMVRGAGLVVVASGYVRAALDVMPPGPVKSILLRLVFGGAQTECPLLATSVYVVGRKP